MVKFLLALHIVFAVFIVGPLVWAAKTAGRGVRKRDRSLIASAARTVRIYAYVSVLVVGLGFALMSQKTTDVAFRGRFQPQTQPRRYTDYLLTTTTRSTHIADIGDTWIWLSLVLWAVAVGIVLLELVPTLSRATKLIDAADSASTLTMRVAAAGGVVSALFIAIVFLMVYKPGR